MIRIRPVQVEKCCICGEEFDKIKMKEIFIGRTKYVCMPCYRAGQLKVDAMKRHRRSSSRGKQIIDEANKHK